MPLWTVWQYLSARDPDVTLADCVLAAVFALALPMRGDYDAQSLATFRAKLESLSGGAYARGVEKRWAVEEIEVRRDEGDAPLRVLLHTPKPPHDDDDESTKKTDKKKLPLVVWAHGGGFCAGSARDGTGLEVFTALRDAGVAVAWASVDYRLAPEHPHPAAIEDVVLAAKTLDATLEARGFASLSLAGVSAGATLALRAALDDADFKLASLFLYAPFLDPAADSASYVTHGARWNLAPFLRWCWAAYKDDEKPPVLARDDAYFAKLGLAANETLVLTSRGDPLHDEGLALVEKLKTTAEAGAVFHVDGKGSHAVAHLVDATASKRLFAEWAAALRGDDS
mmetsp:Transcript_25290/g.100808  ORF Transcript_25290/g.100808 Transcript_25290/m.100808 type:complete len:340 (+) Transcript_25290:1149-2168(+)